MSFKIDEDVVMSGIMFIFEVWMFVVYECLFCNFDFLLWFVNSVIVIIFVIFGWVFFNLFVGYVFVCFCFCGCGVVFVVLIVVMLVLIVVLFILKFFVIN